MPKQKKNFVRSIKIKGTCDLQFWKKAKQTTINILNPTETC